MSILHKIRIIKEEYDNREIVIDMGSAACTSIDCCDGFKVIEDTVSPTNSKYNSTPELPKFLIKRKSVRPSRKPDSRRDKPLSIERLQDRNTVPERSCQIMYTNNQIYHSDSMHPLAPAKLFPNFGNLPNVPLYLMR